MFFPFQGVHIAEGAEARQRKNVTFTSPETIDFLNRATTSCWDAISPSDFGRLIKLTNV